MSFIAKNKRGWSPDGDSHYPWVHIADGVAYLWSATGELMRSDTGETWPAKSLEDASTLIDRIEGVQPQQNRASHRLE